MRLINSDMSLMLAGIALLVSAAVVEAATCALPSTYRWTSSGPLANPKPGWVSIKDFTHVVYNRKHLVYGSTFDSKVWGSMSFGLFSDWSQMSSASQNGMNQGTVARRSFSSGQRISGCSPINGVLARSIIRRQTIPLIQMHGLGHRRSLLEPSLTLALASSIRHLLAMIRICISSLLAITARSTAQACL